MSKDIPYYVMDGEGNTQQVTAGEAYIDDGDLKELLIELLGDDISEEEDRAWFEYVTTPGTNYQEWKECEAEIEERKKQIELESLNEMLEELLTI